METGLFLKISLLLLLVELGAEGSGNVHTLLRYFLDSIRDGLSLIGASKLGQVKVGWVAAMHEVRMIRSMLVAIGTAKAELSVIQVVVNITVSLMSKVTVHVRCIVLVLKVSAVVKAMEAVMTPVGGIEMSEVSRKHLF